MRYTDRLEACNAWAETALPDPSVIGASEEATEAASGLVAFWLASEWSDLPPEELVEAVARRIVDHRVMTP